MSKGLEELEKAKKRTGLPLNQEFAPVTIDELDIIEKELKNKEKYENLIQELCNYLGLDNLFPYDNLEKIEKEIKTMADNAHWYIANKNQKALEIISKAYGDYANHKISEYELIMIVGENTSY